MKEEGQARHIGFKVKSQYTRVIRFNQSQGGNDTGKTGNLVINFQIWKTQAI